ncbi:MAG: glycoside hydrolase family 3 N-terminal domain-containing protein [Bacteroidota bacterium]
MRKLAVILLLLFGSAALALWFAPNVPALQRVKRTVAPFLAFQSQYEVPNTAREAKLPPLEKPTYAVERSDWESQIARLFVTYDVDLPHLRSPGTILINTANTRVGNRFGRYTSYDPVKTRRVVESILDTMQARRHDVLLYDEGEGGYVMRIGTLPAPAELGVYLAEGEIGRTLDGFVSASPDRAERKQQIRQLFVDYAGELTLQGIDIVLSPVLDIADPAYPQNLIFRDDRFFSDQEALVFELATLYLDVMQEAGLRTIGKHFLTLGSIPVGDAHEVYLVSPEDTAANNEAMRLYTRLANQLDGVMLAPVGNPRDRNRLFLYSSEAVHALRDSVGFSGLVITDELGMNGIKRALDATTLTERERRLTEPAESHHAIAAVLALDAGVDQLMLSRTGNRFPNVLATIRHAYDLDADFRARVDSALVRYGRWVNRGPRTQATPDPAQIASPE